MQHVELWHCKVNAVFRNEMDKKPAMLCSLCVTRNVLEQMKEMLHWIVPMGNLGPWILLPFPANLSSSGSEVLAPESGVLLLGDTANIPLNWKLRLSPRHIEF